jgi:hypothetical protein
MTGKREWYPHAIRFLHTTWSLQAIRVMQASQMMRASPVTQARSGHACDLSIRIVVTALRHGSDRNIAVPPPIPRRLTHTAPTDITRSYPPNRLQSVQQPTLLYYSQGPQKEPKERLKSGSLFFFTGSIGSHSCACSTLLTYFFSHPYI